MGRLADKRLVMRIRLGPKRFVPWVEVDAVTHPARLSCTSTDLRFLTQSLTYVPLCSTSLTALETGCSLLQKRPHAFLIILAVEALRYHKADLMGIAIAGVFEA